MMRFQKLRGKTYKTRKKKGGERHDANKNLRIR